LIPVAPGVVVIIAAVAFPIAGMIFSPVYEICADNVFVVMRPEFFACEFLPSLALDASAGDLSIAEARVGEKGRATKRASFFFVS